MMNFVAIEFDNGLNNTHMLGYLKIPEDFNSLWAMGFRNYIIDKYFVKGLVKIYPLKVSYTTGMNGLDIPGYTNMEEDFKAALSSTYYYPECASTNSIRVQYSKLDPRSPDYTSKDQKL